MSGIFEISDPPFVTWRGVAFLLKIFAGYGRERIQTAGLSAGSFAFGDSLPPRSDLLPYPSICPLGYVFDQRGEDGVQFVQAV